MRRRLLACSVALAVAAACASSPARPGAEPRTDPGDAASPDGAAALAADAADDGGAGANSDGEAVAEGADAAEGDAAEAADASAPCPTNMVSIEGRFCIDVYEASLVEMLPDGTEAPYPHYLAVDGHDVRAVSEPHVFPQGFISEVQAQDACAASGKRLCRYDEWKTACMGPSRTAFPYGDSRQPGSCNDLGKSAVLAVFPAAFAAAAAPGPRQQPGRATPHAARAAHPPQSAKKKTVQHTGNPARRPAAAAAARPPARSPARAGAKTAPPPRRRVVGKPSVRPSQIDPAVWTRLNDPRLGQVSGALALTGDYPACTNDYGVVDIVGNLHEWVSSDPAAPHGTFAGGYYLDTTINGDGCSYATRAHAHEYHDYSTGFRCCAAAE